MASPVQMTTRNGHGITLIPVEDLLLPARSVAKVVPNLTFIKDMEIREGDVLLCSYQKSGTHWVGHLIKELRKKSPDEKEQSQLTLLELEEPDKVKAAASPRQITTHLMPKRIPNALLNHKCKIVFLVRNPKDVAVSFYHHLKSSILLANPQTWDEYFVSFSKGQTLGSPYFDYMDAWEAVLKDVKSEDKQSNIELFYFEELKQNPLENIRRLSKHLGYDKTDNEIKQIIDACSIGNLREKVNKESANIPPPLKDKDGKSIIFRKGDVGDWKNHFTVSQNEAFDKLIESRLNGSVFQFKYELD